MSKIDWRFPPLGDGNETGYTNQGIESYKGTDLIDNLTREICQNSLDAKDKEIKEKPVIVEFKLIEIEQNEYDLFNGYKQCLEGCRTYWKSRMDDKLKMFLSEAEKTLKKPKIPVLIASDFNTTGLTGSKAKLTEKSVWRGLVQSDGTSVKSGDSAGSYGIGKNAPFACSSLSMVLYNTYAIDDAHAFQGVARLATLMMDNKPTQSIGHYKVIDKEIGSPITKNEKCSIRDLFSRNKYGTDVAIIGFTAMDSWKDSVIKAVVNNFFLAVYEKKLIVKVDDFEISNKTLEKTFDKYKDSDKKISISYEMYNAVTANDKKFIKEIYNSNVEMFLKIDTSYHRNIGYFRNSGMLVRQRKKNKLERFAAVIVIRGKTLGSLLKDAEPSKHNKWDANIISDTKRKNAAQKAIKEIDSWIEEILEECFRIPIGDSIDADVGEYLPDEIDDIQTGNKSEGKDKLRVIQKISEITPISVIPKSKYDAGQTSGIPIPGEPHNSSNSYNKISHKTMVVKESAEGETSGIDRVSGNKSIISPKVLGQRVVPRSSIMGNYYVKLKLESSSDNIFLQFLTVGEDNNRDKIIVKTYVANGIKHKDVNKNKIGPISVKAHELTEISVVMNNNEKSLINMVVTDER